MAQARQQNLRIQATISESLDGMSRRSTIGSVRLGQVMVINPEIRSYDLEFRSSPGAERASCWGEATVSKADGSGPFGAEKIILIGNPDRSIGLALLISQGPHVI
jgi:hypothetical protein